MANVDLSRARFKPFAHQVVGVNELVRTDDPQRGRVIRRCFGLFDEMRLGKTKQVIDAAQVLFERDEIDQVLVVCPAPARVVWYDPDPTFGEIARHGWDGVPSVVAEYHQRSTRWTRHDTSARSLSWVITNYEFIRSRPRCDKLEAWCTPRTLIVADESSAIKNPRAQQSLACLRLRRRCGWAWALNGTPISNSPLDAYGQCEFLDSAILGCKSFFHFRARYALLGGFLNKQVLGFQNLEDLQRRMKPYVLRRLKNECLDLPAKLPPVALEVALAPETWKVYRQMRDDMVAWLDQQVAAVAPQGGVKALRLAQITSGFVGGVQEEIDEDPDVRQLQEEQVDPVASTISVPEVPGRPGFIPYDTTGVVQAKVIRKLAPRAVGDEKLSLLLDWLKTRFDEDPCLKVIIWCRFRPAVSRLVDQLAVRFPDIKLGTIWGGQKRIDRESALRLLKPGLAPSGPVIVVGTPSSGSMSIDLAAASLVVYESNDLSLKTRLQSEDRAHGPGSTGPVSYYDVIATGPKGQRTIDHAIVKALREHQNLATWTCSAWRRALTEE